MARRFSSFLLGVSVFVAWMVMPAVSATADAPVNLQQYDLAFSKGILKFNEGRYDQAQLLFMQALDAKPGDQDAGYYLGQSLIRTRNFAAAEQTFQWIVDADPSFGRGRLGLAMSQFYQDKYREALKHLEAAKATLPNDPLVYYFTGLAYIRLGEYEQAREPLAKAMQMSPDIAPESHYQLGIAEYGRGQFEEAKREFEAVVAAEPTSEVASSARAFLVQLRDGVTGTERRQMDPTQPRAALPPAEPKRWDLTFSTSFQYDSNVVLLPLGVQPPGGPTGIARKDDIRTVLTARGEYRPLQTEHWVVGTAYGFYQSFHRTLSGFDVQNHTPSLYVQHRYGRFQSRVDYLFDYVEVGRAPFLVSHAVRPVFSVREGTSSFTQLQLGYQDKDFKSDRFDLNTLRDGKNWLIGISQFFHFANNAGVARIGYIFDTDRTGGGSPQRALAPSNADWAYTGHRFSAGVRLPPVWTLTPDFTLDFYRQNYDNPNSFSRPGDVARQGTVVRRDNIYIATAGLSRPITSNLLVGVQYSYTRDESNVALFDYVRHVYSVTLSGSF